MTKDDIRLAAKTIQEHFSPLPACAVILGSGWTACEKDLGSDCCLDYARIAGFQMPSVPGHSGRIIRGRPPADALFLLGRLHAYEGYAAENIVFPIRALAEAGITMLLLTNAAGALDADLQPGDLCLIEDQLNLLGENPLKQIAAADGRHLDCSELYDANLRQLLLAVADKQKIGLKKGIYAAVNGPQYETPAEARMLRTLGADLVGMSTAAEALAAKHAGMRVVGLSLISNRAGGRASHPEVLERVNQSAGVAARLIKHFLRELP